jgi:hypothetical protein
LIQQLLPQFFVPGLGAQANPQKMDNGEARLLEKNQGRTYNFKPAVLMHFHSAADNCATLCKVWLIQKEISPGESRS